MGLEKSPGGKSTRQPKLTSIKNIGLTKQTVNKLEQLVGRKVLIDEAVEEAMADLELCTRQRVLNKVADAPRPEPIESAPPDLRALAGLPYAGGDCRVGRSQQG